MSERVAALIVNFNMPERTDALAEYIAANVKWPVDVIVIDNGSDLKAPSKYTALRLDENIQTTGGWLMGLHYADALARKHGEPYLAYWFIITSAEFVSGDPLTPMAQYLQANPDAVGVHPALTQDSTTSWGHLKTPGPTWMIDNISSLYRADWFDGIGRFDPDMRFAWGIDLETCWKARQQGKGLYIHPDAQVQKVTDIGYRMNRMGMSADERKQLAGQNMAEVLSSRYGPDWWARMTQEYRG
jgi:hypothetical protein